MTSGYWAKEGRCPANIFQISVPLWKTAPGRSICPCWDGRWARIKENISVLLILPHIPLWEQCCLYSGHHSPCSSLYRGRPKWLAVDWYEGQVAVATWALPFFSLQKHCSINIVRNAPKWPSCQGLCLKGGSFDAIGKEKIVSISVSDNGNFWKGV